MPNVRIVVQGQEHAPCPVGGALFHAGEPVRPHLACHAQKGHGQPLVAEAFKGLGKGDGVVFVESPGLHPVGCRSPGLAGVNEHVVLADKAAQKVRILLLLCLRQGLLGKGAGLAGYAFELDAEIQKLQASPGDKIDKVVVLGKLDGHDVTSSGRKLSLALGVFVVWNRTGDGTVPVSRKMSGG